MDDSKKAAGGGVSILGLLGVAFVVLKLCGVIDWSWWWVTAPFWGGPAMALALIVGVLFAAAIFSLVALIVALLSKQEE